MGSTGCMSSLEEKQNINVIHKHAFKNTFEGIQESGQLRKKQAIPFHPHTTILQGKVVQ